LCLERGDYEIALEHLVKSLEILQKTDDKRPLTYTYCFTAQVYLNMKDLQKAYDFCKLAYDLSKEIDYKRNITKSSKIFGTLYRMQRRWDESIENFKESIRIAKSIGDEKDLGDTYFEFGLMWKAKGESEKAEEYLNKALTIYEKLNLDQYAEKVSKEL